MNTNDAYAQLVKSVQEIALLQSVGSLLHWDEQTQMPPRAAEHRAAQSSLVARMAHEQFVSPRIGGLLSSVEGSDLVADSGSEPAANVREIRRSYDRARKIPSSLVEEMTRTAVLSQQAWAEARRKSEFVLFAPWLAKTLDLKRQEADCIGYSGERYDALLDDYEPGETAERLRGVFEELRGPLVGLVQRIIASPRRAPVEVLEGHFPAGAQHRFAKEMAQKIGFDFQAGRLDTSVHPFCSGLGPGDTRITTRYDERHFAGAFFGVLHETGHALYDQGLPAAHFGTPLADAISLGIHESQSRLWENFVGRSRPFWRHFFPPAAEAFPGSLGGVDQNAWLFAINHVQPSFIRTESDEVTYNLHILLRFELEPKLLDGELKPEDLPSVWNERMQHYLGILPPDDSHGCLQDIHWSAGLIGYFPTYTLGNLYAAQFYEAANRAIPDLPEQFAHGEFGTLLSWLRENIHKHGKRYRASDLVMKVTGQKLSASPLLRHLEAKASEFYGV